MTDKNFHQGNANTADTEPAAGIGLIGWMLLPLVPSIVFVAYFLISGKIIT